MISALLLLQIAQFDPGVSLRIYDIGTPPDELPQLVAGQTPNIDRRIEAINLRDGEFGLTENFYAELSGEFFAAKAGEYGFRSTSDDGSSVEIDGKKVVENDGIHPPIAAEGKVQLKAGWHRFLVRFFEAGGGEELKVEYSEPGGSWEIADRKVLRCPANLTRVTSPGPKRVVGLLGAKRPGNGMPLEGLHPGWGLIPIRPDDFKPQVGSMAFLPNGSLLVGTFKPNQGGQFLPDLRDGQIYRIDNVLGSSPNPKVSLVAENLQEPLGMCVVDGHVYVSLRSEIAKLIDADKDGTYEGTKTIAKAWVGDNYHHFAFGLVHQDGFLYGALSTNIDGGAPGINGPNPMYRGSTFKVDLSEPYDPGNPMRNMEFITGGHRTPNGVAIGPYGLIVVGENQGAWQPSNKLNVIEPGGFYGHRNNTDYKTEHYPNGGVKGIFDRAYVTPPALHLPQNEIANSPSGSVVITDGVFKDQMLLGDVKFGGLRRAWLEKVEGQWQGGAVQYSQGFECGINRLAWGTDGDLYVGGIGATETWGWTDPITKQWTTFGLQKIHPKQLDTFEIAKVNSTAKGFRVEFTRPVQKFAADKVVARMWDYQPTPDYGGSKKNVEQPKLKKITFNSDSVVDLEFSGLKEGRVVYLNFDVRSLGGSELWATECWFTLNRIPGLKVAVTPTKLLRVLAFSKTAGFRHDSIKDGLVALAKLARQKGFQLTATEDAAIFNSKDLSRFDVVLFLSTTGDVLNPDQQRAFEGFMKGGKGFVGIHAASDTEYDWPFYGQLVGGYFKGHPAITQATINVEKETPETSLLPRPWTRVDEWYNFRQNPRANVEVLASLDEKSYPGGDMGDHPIMWRTKLGRARGWYTGLGHTSSTYREHLFLESLYRGVLWAAGR